MISYIALLSIFYVTYKNPAKDTCHARVEVRADLSDEDFDKFFETAARTCHKKYHRSPCLVKFEQVGPNDFNVTCGAEQ